MAEHATGRKGMSDPEYAARMSRVLRGTIDNDFGPLFHKLMLTPEKKAELKHRLTEKRVAETELNSVLEGNRELAKSPAIGELRLEMNREANASIRELLGEEDYLTLARYETVLPVRKRLKHYERRLSYSNQPLGSDQVEALAEALALDSAQRLDTTGRIALNDPRIATLLTPDQLQAFNDVTTALEAIRPVGR